MDAPPISRRISNLFELLNPLYQFMTDSPYVQRAGEPGICDFVVGNPHELPLPDFVSALTGSSLVWFGAGPSRMTLCPAE